MAGLVYDEKGNMGICIIYTRMDVEYWGIH